MCRIYISSSCRAAGSPRWHRPAPKRTARSSSCGTRRPTRLHASASQRRRLPPARPDRRRRGRWAICCSRWSRARCANGTGGSDDLLRCRAPTSNWISRTGFYSPTAEITPRRSRHFSNFSERFSGIIPPRRDDRVRRSSVVPRACSTPSRTPASSARRPQAGRPRQGRRCSAPRRRRRQVATLRLPHRSVQRLPEDQRRRLQGRRRELHGPPGGACQTCCRTAVLPTAAPVSR